MDPETMQAARRQQAERTEQTQYTTLTAEDIDNLKHQVSEVLAETFKAAVEMSVHFQVRVRMTIPDHRLD